jgi:PKD repeat protein
MKRIILLGLFLFSLSVNAQNFYTSGNCKAAFKFEINTEIMTFAPATVLNFFDTSEGNAKQWYWDFGEGQLSNEKNPVHIFNHPIGGPNVKISPYRTVTLTIVTDSCKSTFSQLINIFDGTLYEQQSCQAHFKFYETARDSAEGMVTFKFVNGSVGNDLKYNWQFGDFATSSEMEPAMKFSMKQSEYKVCLTVIGSDSCSSTFCETVYLNKPDIFPPTCKAAFGFDAKNISDSTELTTLANFYYKSYPEATEWFWDFGDGTTSTEANPTHEFKLKMPADSILVDPNPFRTICLTVVTVDGCKVSYCETVNVFDLGTSPNEPDCQALFKYYESGRDTIGGTAKIVFNNYSEGKDLKYFWQFGDLETSTEKEPIHKFSLDQTEYKVCLTVTRPDGCSSIDCKPVYLEYSVITDTIMPDCVVDFGFTKEDLLMSPLPSAVFKFYYKSFPEATEWYWDFGDGSASNEPNPSHVYTQQYFYSDSLLQDSLFTIMPVVNPYRTVCLTIKTADGCKVSTCQTILVFDEFIEPEKCPVYFKYYQPDDIMSIPEVVPIQLVDVTDGEVISRLWQFEDGSTSTEKEPLVTFNIFQPVHKVCLTVTFADSCTNTFCDAVYVGNGYTDTVVVVDPIIINPDCPYYMKIDGEFPPYMSSCAGWASVKVYLKDDEVIPQIISWSTGDTLAKVSGLCPTRTYTVKALMPDGCAIWTNFIFNSDGSVTPVSPINWWLDGKRENQMIKANAAPGMKVEWRLCDGTVIEADSVLLADINCGTDEANLILKDDLGNVIYTENIALKGSVTGINDIPVEPEIKLWPNPVSSKLNIKYSGEYQSKITVEISDIMGKLVSSEIYSNISDGQEFSINTEPLKQGIYICRISAAGKTIKAHKFSRK